MACRTMIERTASQEGRIVRRESRRVFLLWAALRRVATADWQDALTFLSPSAMFREVPVFMVVSMLRALTLLALLPLLLPPGLCACGAVESCCASADDGDDADHDHTAPSDSPHHAPTCPAAAISALRAPVARLNLSVQQILTDRPTSITLELHSSALTAAFLAPADPFDLPVYLRLRALLI